jgi:hypothetical protein
LSIAAQIGHVEVVRLLADGDWWMTGPEQWRDMAFWYFSGRWHCLD